VAKNFYGALLKIIEALTDPKELTGIEVIFEVLKKTPWILSIFISWMINVSGKKSKGNMVDVLNRLLLINRPAMRIHTRIIASQR
jgi:hypothetical protein